MSADELRSVIWERIKERRQFQMDIMTRKVSVPPKKTCGKFIEDEIDSEIMFLMRLGVRIAREGVHPGDITGLAIEVLAEDNVQYRDVKW